MCRPQFGVPGMSQERLHTVPISGTDYRPRSHRASGV